jgi:hypothetical protein
MIAKFYDVLNDYSLGERSEEGPPADLNECEMRTLPNHISEFYGNGDELWYIKIWECNPLFEKIAMMAKGNYEYCF